MSTAERLQYSSEICRECICPEEADESELELLLAEEDGGSAW